MADALSVRCDAPVGSLRLQVEFGLTEPWTVLFGPSGSGKSSLLRLIAGIWTPENASVLLRGQDVTALPPHLRRIGLVMQQPALFPHRTVLQNIRFGCPGGPGCAEFIADLVELFELQTLQEASVARLSGGERQRVALARALAARPRLLLLDEVFTGMHRTQRDELRERLRAHCASLDVPVLSVTHDVPEALSPGGNVLRIADGRVVAHGPAAEVLAAERESLRALL